LSRVYYIDWLRVFAVLLLVPFHTAMIFVFWDFHLKNPERSASLTDFNSFLDMWQMPLLLVLSGAGTWFALGHRNALGYVKERIQRLLIPLVFGMFVVIPPQVYVERISKGQFDGPYWQFYPHILDGIYPAGNFSWHHLWFLAYLFVFSMLLVPVTARLRREESRAARERIGAFLERPGRLLLMALPLMLFEATLRLVWHGEQNLINDWANFCVYITTFFWGYVLCCDGRIGEAILRQRRTFLALAVACAVFFKLLSAFKLEPVWGYNAPSMALLALRAFNTWCWVLALMGYGKRRLDFTNGFLRYATEAVLPFYILHQTIIIIIGYYVIRWEAGIAPKFIFICVAALITTVTVYEIFVRHIPPMRFLFGMKPTKSPAAVPPPQGPQGSLSPSPTPSSDARTGP